MKLKLITLIILAIFAIGCATDTSTSSDTIPASEDEPDIVVVDDPPVTDPTTDTEPIIIEKPIVVEVVPELIIDATPDVPTTPTIKFALHAGSDLYLFDGSDLSLWGTGVIHRTGPMEFSIDDIIYTLDIYGNEFSTQTLPKTPTAIKRTSEGVYWCYQYSKVDAAAMGGRYAFYSEFYFNDTIISQWWNNQTECRDIVSVGNNVWSINENGAYTLIAGTATNVSYVNDGEFYIHSRDTVSKTIGFNDRVEDYGYNYISNATEWVDSSGDYYSGNGYIWSSSEGLREQTTALNDFNAYPYPIEPEPIYGQAPVILAAGSHDGKLYWIECNSGHLFEYSPSTDTLTQVYRLYIGDGMHSTGMEKKPFIKPFISEGVLYFTDSGSVMELDLESGFINIFYAGYGEVLKYD